MEEHVSIGKAAKILGVTVVMLRRWQESGVLVPAWRTPGKHRRYSMEQLRKFTEGKTSART